MIRLRSLAAVFLFFVSSALAAEKNPVVAQTNAIVAKINTKIQSGARSEADIKPELAEFDALIAAHRSEKTEEVAAAIMMKVSLYLDVFQDTAEAKKLLLVLKNEFPKTEIGSRVDEMLFSLKKLEDAQKIQATLVIGQPFPDFQEKDLLGKPLSISRFHGKVLLVDFWATWCPPCVQEMPNIVAIYEKYHNQGLEVLGISLDDDKTRLTRFMAKTKMSWPQYFEGKHWDNKLAIQYGVIQIPETYLLDKNGIILDSHLTGEALASAIQKALTAK